MDFTLPGRGEAKEGCGQIGFKACFHAVHGPKVPYRKFRQSCGRRDCPVCWESWAVEQALEITHRAWIGSQLLKKGKPVHGILSPPPGTLAEESSVEEFRELRTMAYEVLKFIGYVHGGAVVFHPWRCRNAEGAPIGGHFLQADGIPVWGPHFHYIGPGWNVEGRVKAMYEQTGWVFKRKRVLNSEKAVYGVAHYALTHCGVDEHTQSYTWFGDFSNSSQLMKDIPDREVIPDTCPLGHPWLRVKWNGKEDPPPDETGETEWTNFVVEVQPYTEEYVQGILREAVFAEPGLKLLEGLRKMTKLIHGGTQRSNTSDVIIKTDLSNGGV